MVEETFDTLTRRTADGTSRRTSLAALGGAALTAAIAGPSTASAKSRKCKKAKKAKKKAKRKCRNQVGQCEDANAFFCSNFGPQAQECLAQLNPCCQSLGNCDAGTATACLVDGAFSLVPVD